MRECAAIPGARAEGNATVRGLTRGGVRKPSHGPGRAWPPVSRWSRPLEVPVFQRCGGRALLPVAWMDSLN
ncbi:hypothetical protein AKJ09_05554 [Labilithrix luteola]|uniref:Uncharacterized protein n=1 Tax=Labilithrix luteola TaxID=1391654 RepID=A0A0K1PZC6_9BACT|nr:hypothetical protein AKJ09_05554 [Labilithrix luteola]